MLGKLSEKNWILFLKIFLMKYSTFFAVQHPRINGNHQFELFCYNTSKLKIAKCNFSVKINLTYSSGKPARQFTWNLIFCLFEKVFLCIQKNQLRIMKSKSSETEKSSKIMSYDYFVKDSWNKTFYYSWRWISYIWNFAFQFSSATWLRIWLQLASFTWPRWETTHWLQCISKLWSKVSYALNFITFSCQKG